MHSFKISELTTLKRGLKKEKSDFRLLLDVALSHEGSYFLTYHRWARKDQLLEAYPQFPQFLKLKLKYDPQEMFQSDWYRFYKNMFSEDSIKLILSNHFVQVVRLAINLI